MKVLLFDMENQLHPALLGEAYDIVKTSTEYDINNPEPGYFHFISTQPDYHVEIILKEEGMADAKCHCTIYKKSRKCKHAVAALLLLRDHLQRHRKSRKKSNRETLEEVMKKMNVTDLRSFITSYAMSHTALRADILSNYLYLTKRPDYHSLFNDLAPLDKYGQLRINRNNIKTVRAVSTTLLKRAQDLLKDQALAEAILILEAVLIHLHKFWAKLPQFQEQLMVDLKYAYRLFELFCNQSMALRLQQRATLLALNISDRESYIFPQGMKPLIQTTEHFLLEEKSRKEAFAIAEKKVKSGSLQSSKWIALIYHWMRIWSIPVSNAFRAQLEIRLPDIIREMSLQGDHADALFSIQSAADRKYDRSATHSILQAGLVAANMTGEKGLLVKFAYDLAVKYTEEGAWVRLLETNKSKAIETLHIIGELYPPGTDKQADLLVLKGWNTLGNMPELISRLDALGDINLVMLFDSLLREKNKPELETLYARLIHSMREMYGGVIARQKLNTIFSHLKAVNLYQAVADKIKLMERPKHKVETPIQNQILGFVFDLDGVIVDTAEHHYQSWKKILRELGAEITKEDDHHTRGASRMESLEYLTDKYNIKLSGEEKHYWAVKKNEVYLDSIQHITPADILPGALSFLEESRKMGLMVALGSASKNARMVLDKLAITDKFDAIVDGNDAQKSKPDPEVFIKASVALGLDGEQVVVFEDAGKGVQAALAAGCKVVGIGDISTLTGAHLVIPDLIHARPSQIIQQLA